ncbi:MAG: GNAT family N-acetyltransferase [Dermatophilaceae bacterium]
MAGHRGASGGRGSHVLRGRPSRVPRAAWAVVIREQGGAGELEVVRDVTRRAFGVDGAHVADLVAALQADDAYTGRSWVAETGGEVVGHTMLTRGWVDAPERLITVPVLSPLSVAPASQGCGVGGALVRHALGDARARGEWGVILEGDPAYYGRLGFVAAERHGLLRPRERIPSAAFQVVLFAAHEPWMTGRVVYPDRFWAFDAVGLRE